MTTDDHSAAKPERPMLGAVVFLLGFFVVHGLSVLCTLAVGSQHCYLFFWGPGITVMFVFAKRIARDPIRKAKMLCAASVALSVALATIAWLLGDWFSTAFLALALITVVLRLLSWIKDLVRSAIKR